MSTFLIAQHLCCLITRGLQLFIFIGNYDKIILVIEMKKIHRSKFASSFLIFTFIVHIAFTFIFIKVVFDMIEANNNAAIIALSIEFILLTAFFIVSYIFFNKVGAIIIYDKDNNVLIRKGYLFGYKSTIKISDILKVEKVTLSRDDTYYVLIDNVHSKYEGGSNKSFYSITCSKESKEFIEQFWDEPLERFYN